MKEQNMGRLQRKRADLDHADLLVVFIYNALAYAWFGAVVRSVEGEENSLRAKKWCRKK